MTEPVSEVRYGFADHHCFACGTTNPSGMGLRIELGDQRAGTTWVPGPDDVGWSDRVHGGLIATVLDEVMAWASGSEDAWAVTSSFSVRFHSPASPGETLLAEAWVASRRRRIYEIKSKDDPKSWQDLIHLCKVLNETAPGELEQALSPILDIDGALKFLALDNALINNDGYWIRTSDYSLYQDEKGRFHVLPSDSNETFVMPGGPGFGGGGPGGPRGAGGGAPGGRRP